jgi:3-keto-5-aminohexanoate cleavage enzyme
MLTKGSLMNADKLLVTVAPCVPPYVARGLPGLDLSPQAIAAEVVRSHESGACLAHLHVWDEAGNPTEDLAALELTVRLIRERCDIIIEGSTGGIGGLSAEQRSVVLRVDVELASLNMGSVNYDRGVYVNSPEDIEYWAKEMRRGHIKPDMSIFEAGMISNSLALIDRGVVEPPFLYGFVLGQQGAMAASPRNLVFLAESLPAGSLWSVFGHGGADLQMAGLAMSMGGHVRAGFEDNPYFRPGELARSNAQLVERLVGLAKTLGREVATPAEARAALGLASRS